YRADPHGLLLRASAARALVRAHGPAGGSAAALGDPLRDLHPPRSPDGIVGRGGPRGPDERGRDGEVGGPGGGRARAPPPGRRGGGGARDCRAAASPATLSASTVARLCETSKNPPSTRQRSSAPPASRTLSVPAASAVASGAWCASTPR